MMHSSSVCVRLCLRVYICMDAYNIPEILSDMFATLRIEVMCVYT